MIIETINLHIWSRCNLECRYCYETFPERPRSLDFDGWCRVLDELARENVTRVTFSGGEPTLYPELLGLLVYARSVGLQTSIISNGARLEAKHIANLDLVGLSLDAADERTLIKLGRHREGRPSYIDRIRYLAGLAHEQGTKLKLNTVVTAWNADADLNQILRELHPWKWKPMQFTYIPGENDQWAPQLEIDDTTFRRFLRRHEGVKSADSWVQEESSETVRSTYVMIDPRGKAFQPGRAGYRYSRQSVLESGLESAVNEVGGYDRPRFLARGGNVDVRRLPLLGEAQ